MQGILMPWLADSWNTPLRDMGAYPLRDTGRISLSAMWEGYPLWRSGDGDTGGGLTPVKAGQAMDAILFPAGSAAC